MRQKLKTFADFAELLYPHELDYLCSVEQFKKEENRALLLRIRDNFTVPQTFDPTIDKRTYSYVKSWIERTLNRVDVDLFFSWLIETERKVMLDVITPADEDAILSQMENVLPTHYSFLRFYEMLQRYRDYMMVRSRHRNQQLVSAYLTLYETNWLRSTEINRQLLIATQTIVSRQTDAANSEVEELLLKIYEDVTLDGYTRYRAVVRLTIQYYNTRRFETLRSIYNQLDAEFRTSIFYSRRLLANYYSNRAMMHSKLGELPSAEMYATLAVRNPNSDYLLYLVNLCAILLKAGKTHQANRLMRSAIPQLKNTHNKYYKIGFVAFYIRTMLATGQQKQAVEYASNYFNAYRKDIFDHRWHLFIVAYLQALIQSDKYVQVIQLCIRYKLPEREQQRINHPDYLPIIQTYLLVSQYMEGNGTRQQLIDSLIKLGSDTSDETYRTRKFDELLTELAPRLPDEIREVRHIGLL